MIKLNLASAPARPIFFVGGEPALRNAHRILKPGGVICSQGECLWLNEDEEGKVFCGASGKISKQKNQGLLYFI